MRCPRSLRCERGLRCSRTGTLRGTWTRMLRCMRTCGRLDGSESILMLWDVMDRCMMIVRIACMYYICFLSDV